MQNTTTPKSAPQGENAYLTQCGYVDNLTAFGLMTPQQAQIFKQNMALRLNNTNVQKPKNETAFAEFEKTNPDFFKSRQILREYLESVDVELSAGEFEKIAALIYGVEQQAVLRYKQELEQGKALENANAEALERLNTNSMREGTTAVAGQKIFTPQEIGAMSSEEFKRNEAAINEQLAKGLIR
jgi:hypothetical protein